jgi:tol-pal system-associated acyl-CoA thioesterase
MLPPKRLAIKVYLEDTDAQGIVYHANYLKFFERARSELLETSARTSPGQIGAERRYVVHEMRLKYLRPALLGDRLEVHSTARRASEFRLQFEQRVVRAGEEQTLVSAQVDLVCVNAAGDLIELPEHLRLD